MISFSKDGFPASSVFMISIYHSSIKRGISFAFRQNKMIFGSISFTAIENNGTISFILMPFERHEGV